MTLTFSSQIKEDGVAVVLTEKRLLKALNTIGPQEWDGQIGKQAARILRALLEDGAARIEGEALLFSHETATKIPAMLAEAIAFPPLAAVSLNLRMEGRIDSAEARIKMFWSDAKHRTITPKQQGAFIEIGGHAARLSPMLFQLVEAVEHFNGAGSDVEARIAAWKPVQDQLATEAGEAVSVDGFMRSLTFYQAGAFSLDVIEGLNGPDFRPVLMSRSKATSLEDEAPTAEWRDGEEISDVAHSDLRDQLADALLPSELQRRFDEKMVSGDHARDAYVLGRNVYVVLPPEMKTALDVVQRKRRAPPEERREFLRNPRAALNDALATDGVEAVHLFVETAQYSDRVEGLGVWEKIDRAQCSGNTDWLPETFPGRTEPASKAASPITAENIAEARQVLAQAQAEGRETLVFHIAERPVAGFADEIEQVTRDIATSLPIDQGDRPKPEPSEPVQPLGLLTKSNIAEVEYTVPLKPRHAFMPNDFPADRMGRNKPKEHQTAGFQWLVEAWRKGWPGVLLADDMGLGKTFQALAFLAWIKANLEARGQQHPTEAGLGPILVVAPTALLKNWRAEAQLHLASDCLGDPVEAFGVNLRKLKRSKENREEALDIEALREAGWILTTYETMADYHRAFARIAYSVVVFDEIQKIKEPGSINTRSAKTLNADFVLGLTGTPVENRIEDLWSIFDRIAPGFLRSLNEFSRIYGDENPEALKRLKEMLDHGPEKNVPAPMLRRMKDKARDGLPDKYIKHYPTEMPPEQAKAYAEVVAAAKDETSRKSMLETLHKMRGVSLHPQRADTVDTSNAASILDWLGKSARLSRALNVLKEIEALGDKAIVFVEDLAIQRAFAEALGNLFDLPRIPAIINGGISGEKRQEIVEKFQKSGPGFSVLVLSPKAAGLGLTITAANHVIHLSRWWNPAVEDQCNDRAYRIGATRDVFVHIPMAVHPQLGEASFDHKLNSLLERKRALSRDMLAPPEGKDDLSSLYRGTIG